MALKTALQEHRDSQKRAKARRKVREVEELIAEVNRNQARLALYPELVKALGEIQDWLLFKGPVVDDGITHPAFVKANNLTAKVLAQAEALKGE